MRSIDETATAKPEPATASRTRDPVPAPDVPPIDLRVDPELAGELHGGPWDYPWELAPGIDAPTGDPLARQIAWVREALIEPYAIDGLALNEERLALDLNCGEGHLAQRLLDWGAKRVTGVSDDPEVLHRARLLRRHFAIGEALELLTPAELETPAEPDHDVVVLAPMPADAEAAIEAAASHCRGVCALECADAEADSIAERALAAGFASVERLDPPTHAVAPFLLGAREILIARVRRLG